jgi:hypothetical protein
MAQVLKEQLPHNLTVRVQLFLEWNLSWLELGTDYLWLSADLFQVRKKAVEYAGSKFMVFFLITPLILFEIYEILLKFQIQNQELPIRETFLKRCHFLFSVYSVAQIICIK